MNHLQEDLLAQQFSNINADLKPFAFDILKSLFYNSEKGLNIKEIYYELGSKNILYIRKAINEMDKLNLIQINKKKCDGCEKRYFITQSGKAVIHLFYADKFN